MSSIISTESRSDTSGNVGTGGTLKELKTDFANLLINRVTLGECLNVIRDACVARAGNIIDEADDPTLENIKKDVATFKAGSEGEAGSEDDDSFVFGGEAGSEGEAGSYVGDGSAATAPVEGGSLGNVDGPTGP